ncbi:hypothetical protein [Nocardia heshunensis]
MNLWNQLVEPQTAVVDSLSRAERAELATRTIESTSTLFDPSFTEYFPPEVAQLITSATQDFRASAPEWLLPEAYTARFTTAFDAIQDIAMRPGCGPLTVAVLDLVHGLTGELETDTVQEVLFSCYDAILVSQLTGLVTLEKEQNNGQCQRAITLQLDLTAEWR